MVTYYYVVECHASQLSSAVAELSMQGFRLQRQTVSLRFGFLVLEFVR